MTDITKSSVFSISNLRSVTDKLNKIIVPLPQDIFFYDSHWAMPQILDEPPSECNLGDIFSSLGLLMANNMVMLLSPSYEKYIANLLGISYFELVSPTSKTKYTDFFRVLNINKLNCLYYKKDIIYVYNDTHIVVVYDLDTKRSIRKLRGNG